MLSAPDSTTLTRAVFFGCLKNPPVFHAIASVKRGLWIFTRFPKTYIDIEWLFSPLQKEEGTQILPGVASRKRQYTLPINRVEFQISQNVL